MNVTISGEYIELSKLLKHLGRVDSGGEAKLAISGGLVFVNGEEELRIRRKCVIGDMVEFEGEKVIIKYMLRSRLNPTGINLFRLFFIFHSLTI